MWVMLYTATSIYIVGFVLQMKVLPVIPESNFLKASNLAIIVYIIF